ncbi:hypothetical protein CLV24_11447 [Pontibacter ummariensis]|uniref:Uncharacterized protein n=1 Tax=Pontibacter ummariensis TaxID=1610492 RepID=A0A239HPF4_9BACT|nr:hypothetical protein [Pontibacter ummariensis]PRY10319.1 hypothetical protein CLV24_11447 [Pontibacter ummariensis]SNS82144.1 hypothetical protein SAMN06296052_11447 [Pontibacter ummariensis]
MKKLNYRPLRKTDEHLVCFQSLDGNGQDREYLVMLDQHTMQEVNLTSNTTWLYHNSEKPLPEYAAWKLGRLQVLGYRICTFEAYLFAQDTLDSRLKPKPAPVDVKVRFTHFKNHPLTEGTVPV